MDVSFHPYLLLWRWSPWPRPLNMHQNISDYSNGFHDFKLCMYADDVILFLSLPWISLPNLPPILQKFTSHVSGFNSRDDHICIATQGNQTIYV